MSRLARRCAAVLVGTMLVTVAGSVIPGAQPAHAPLASRPAPPPAPPSGEVPPTSTPAPEWEYLFVDHFDGPAGAWPDQWHYMPGWNAAAQNGLGQLEVGHVGQIRSTAGWMLPAGTQVRVSASLVMPNTGSNYAALWIQHPNAADPREIDVIESYGPMKTAGAQLGSHLCYDETVEDAIDDCAAAGLSPELWPVAHAFPAGAKPWESFWQYHAEFTVGGDRVQFQAQDGSGNQAYAVSTLPDPRRVPGNAVPIHLRLSNKEVDPEHVISGGDRYSMLVDWVTVQVKYPTDVS